MKKTLLSLMGLCIPIFLFAQNPQPKDRDYRILQMNRKFKPDKGFRADDQLSKRDSRNPNRVKYQKGNYFLIQFNELPGAAVKAQLQSLGVKLLDYVPYYAYYAHLKQEISSDQFAALNIRTVMPVEESFKLAESIYKNNIPRHALKGQNIELEITFFEGADLQTAEKFINRTATIKAKLNSKNWVISTPLNQVKSLAAIKEIKFIAPLSDTPKPEKDPQGEAAGGDVFSNNMGRANFLNSGHNGLNYNGEGVNTQVREGDFFYDIDFQGRVLSGSVSNPPGGHAFGVAKYLGNAGNLDQRDRSNAWGANLFALGNTNFAQVYDDPNKKIRITNMSYGWGPDAGYNATSADHDNFIRTKPEAMLVYSSGNDGSTAPTGGKYNGLAGWGNLTGKAKHAKNLITVSGTDDDDLYMEWTCKGPAYDGRIKPELTIEGTGGTSHAAPKVSGILAILNQAYKSETASATAPSALIKAIVMNTADDIYNKGIDFKTGFGRPNVRRAYNVIKESQFSSGQIANGASNNLSIAVPANTAQVKIMLYWHDYEATENAAQALVNDLDLTVTDPSNNLILPWGLDTAANAVSLNALPTRKADHINNAEQITIDNPAAGNYNININGYLIPQGPQQYYITYEFVKDEILMAYPLGGESMAPGTQEYLRWDAYGTPGTYNLDYSIDNGASWNVIAANIAANVKQYKWTVPNLASKIQIRIKRGTQEKIIPDVNILDVPKGFKIDWITNTAFQLIWNKQANATQYEIFKLGQKYMTTLTTTADTSIVIADVNPNQKQWYAIRALAANGLKGLRSTAILKDSVVFNNAPVRTGTAFNVRKTTALLTATVNAFGSTLDSVAFEYGPTTAYGAQTTLANTFTGTNFVDVQQQISINMNPGEIWHYRIKGKLNGQHFFGEDHKFYPAPGQAVAFDGFGNGILTLGSNTAIDGNKPKTIEVWAKAKAFNDGAIFTSGASPGTSLGEFTLRTTTTENLWRATFWNNNKDFTLPNSKDEWHHYALVFDGSNVSFYYDGELKLAPSPVALNTLNGTIKLGVWNSGSGNKYFNGEVDEVKVWNKALTTVEIQQGFHHPANGNENGLIYYFNFDNTEPEVYDVVSKKALPQAIIASRPIADFPLGIGTSDTKTEALGNITYGNGVDVTAFYNNTTPVPAGFSKVTFSSTTFNGIAASATKLGTDYWVGNRFGNNTNLDMNLTFKTSADLSHNDFLNPGKILVFTRLPYGSGKWQYTTTANAVDSVNNTITVNNLKAYGQYLFVKDTQAFLYSSIDALSLNDVRVGVATKAASFTLSGANLPATNIKITAPSGYLISLNDTTYVNSTSALYISPVNGELKNQKVFVKFSPTQGIIYSGNIEMRLGTQLLSSVGVKQEGIQPENNAGNSMAFDGSGDYLEVLDLNWKPTVFTIEWWHKAKTFKNYNQSIGNGWGSFLVHASSDGALNIGVANNTASRMIIPNAFTDVNTWHHYAYTFNNGVAKVYRDGKLMASKTASSLPPNWQTFKIGGSDGNSIDGEIDEFRMWTTEKSQQQIRENMHLTATGAEADLKLYLQFQNAANTVVDISNNSYKVALFGNTVRDTSFVPVAKGISETKQITTASLTDYTQVGVALQFSGTGTNPDGEVVISKLHALPIENVNPSVMDSTYYIINNYGNNASFTGLTGLTFKNLNASGAGVYRLSNRLFNAVGTTWIPKAASVDSTNQVTFNFDTYNTLGTFGQFAVNKTPGYEPVEKLAGKAMSFDETGDYLEIQDLNWKPTVFTIEWWHKPKSYKSYNQSIGNGWGSFLVHADGSGNLNVGVANNSASRIVVPNAFNQTNVWHHFAYTFNNGSAKVYMDGKLVGSKAASSMPPTWATFKIGEAGNNSINGEIDEFRMWSTERTQQQIREHQHLTLQGNETGLKFYLQGQGSSQLTNLIDVSSNHYNVKSVGTIDRPASAAPVAEGSSQTLTIAAAGRYDFNQEGLALNFASSASYPQGDVVVSKLNSNPYNAPAGVTNNGNTYWIVRNYDFTDVNALTTAERTGPNDPNVNLKLFKRDTFTTGAWSAGISGAQQQNGLVFPGSGDVLSSHLLFEQTQNLAPNLTFTSPANNTNYKTVDSVKITGTATDADGSIIQLALFNGGTKIADLTSGSFQYNLGTLPLGNHQLIISATDNSGLVGADTLNITVSENQAPQVAISQPVHESVFDTSQSITLQADTADADGYIKTIEFYDGETKIGQQNESVSGGLVWNGAGVGEHFITARVVDNNGLQTISNPIRIVIVAANQAPTVSIAAPGNGILVHPNKRVSLTATATDADGTIKMIEFYEGPRRLATLTQPPYTFTWTPFDEGVYTITAKATDNKDLMSTSNPITINVAKKKDAIRVGNLITPNGDGQNDKWVIEGISNFPNHQVTIFGITGRVLFQTSSYNNESNFWSGLYNGNPLPIGTYFYRIVLNQKDKYTGFITILR